MRTIAIPLVPSVIALIWLVAGLFVLGEEQDTTPRDSMNWLSYSVAMFFVSYGVSAMIRHGFGG